MAILCRPLHAYHTERRLGRANGKNPRWAVDLRPTRMGTSVRVLPVESRPVKRHLIMTVAIVGALALVASACSGGDDESSVGGESIFVRAEAVVAAGGADTVYGSGDDRTAYVQIVRSTAAGASEYGDEVLLAAGDETCRDLAGFVRQDRDVLFAMNVLWTNTLRYLDSTQAALFGAILSSASTVLCPETAEFAAEAVYWLGV